MPPRRPPEIALRSIALKPADDRLERREFPYSVPAIAALPRLELSASVTFLVGANGSGKSTLLEALAVAASLPTIGSEEAAADETLRAQRHLAASLRLGWRRRTHRGFFLRAEDFFGFAKRMARMREEMRRRVAEIDTEYAERSDHARRLAEGPLRASLAEMERLYGSEFDARSHGESFLDLFQARFVPGGLHLLDEPEAALSPQSQLALLAMVSDMVKEDAQFIVATHSPIILAYPGARIFSFDTVPLSEVTYESLEHVSLTRDFLNDPQRYLRHLLPELVGRTRD